MKQSKIAVYTPLKFVAAIEMHDPIVMPHPVSEILQSLRL